MNWYEIFPKLLNMSLTASVIIVFVLLARLLLKKTPKIYSYALWVVVLFRLLCPVSLTAPISLLGIFDTPVVESTENTSTVEYVPSDIVHTEYPKVVLPFPGISDMINETLPQGEEQLVADPLEAPISIATYIWMSGIVVMLGYSFVSCYKLRQKLIGVLHLRENIYMADHISSSFVMGILRPKIYLNSALGEQEQEYIIRHEQYHIRRLDHIFKALAFLALCIHWFNPFVWAAFILSSKDMEMSCDEAVIKKMGEEIRANYASSLLSLATDQRILVGTPLAFGEGDTKERIKNLARWKKPTIWISMVAVLVCVITILVCVFNPKEELLHAPEPFGHTYQVDEILYGAPDYDFEYNLETSILYALNIEYQLDILEDISSHIWLHAGIFEEISLSKDNFDVFFKEPGWSGGVNLSQSLRRDNKQTWRLFINNEGLDSMCYYLLLQKNGEIYLAQGFYDYDGMENFQFERSYMNKLYKMKMTEELSCTAVSEGLEAYLEPKYYPEGFDFEYEDLVYGEINGSGKLIFDISWDADVLTVSEDYYTYSEATGTIEKKNYELNRNEEGKFELEVIRRNDVRDEEAIYFIQGEEGVFVMKILFSLGNSNTSGNGAGVPESVEAERGLLENQGFIDLKGNN